MVELIYDERLTGQYATAQCTTAASARKRANIVYGEGKKSAASLCGKGRDGNGRRFNGYIIQSNILENLGSS